MKFRLGIAGLVLTAVGCGGEVLEPPVLVYTVTGKVTYQGQPVAGADITFHHESSDRSAFGRTNDEGEYQLTTFSANDGAVDGKHGVSIVKFQAPAEASTAVTASVESDEYVPPGMTRKRQRPTAPKTSLPEKYAQQTTSGLTAVVNQQDDNTVDFELTD